MSFIRLKNLSRMSINVSMLKKNLEMKLKLICNSIQIHEEFGFSLNSFEFEVNSKIQNVGKLK